MWTRGVWGVNVQQLSVFVEDKPGQVTAVTDMLGRAGINIRGFSVYDTAEFAIVRLVVSDPDRATMVLRNEGFSVKESDVICVELADHPGGLASVLKTISDAGVNIDYVYSLIGTYAVIAAHDLGRVVTALAGTQAHILSQEELAAQ
jgi:hypothetical protein